MRNKELEEINAMQQMARPYVQSPVGQVAPGIAQAAGAPNADFVNYLQNYSQGQVPDFAKLYQERQAAVNQVQPKEELSIKNVLKTLLDNFGAASQARASNPRLNWAQAMGVGGHANNAAGKEAFEKKKSANEKVKSDLQKIAEDHRKYNHDQMKLDRDMKSQDITDKLHMAQTQKALREPVSGGANWMDKLLATNQLNMQSRKYERQEKEVEEGLKKLPEINNLNAALDSMVEISPNLVTGFWSGPATFGSKITSALGITNGETAASSEEFKTLGLPILKDYIRIFGPQISNEDRKAIEKLLAGEHMEESALNRALGNMQVKVKTEQMHELAKEQYFNSTGSTNGFESAWSKHLDKNPLRDKKTGGLNIDNYQKLQQSFLGNNNMQSPNQGQPQPTMQQIPSEQKINDNPFIGLSPEEIDRMIAEEEIK